MLRLDGVTVRAVSEAVEKRARQNGDGCSSRGPDALRTGSHLRRITILHGLGFVNLGESVFLAPPITPSRTASPPRSCLAELRSEDMIYAMLVRLSAWRYLHTTRVGANRISQEQAGDEDGTQGTKCGPHLKVSSAKFPHPTDTLDTIFRRSDP